MLYSILKRMINKGNYSSIEDMERKLAILFANNQLTEVDYETLLLLLYEE
jgi:hypothetical protein